MRRRMRTAVLAAVLLAAAGATVKQMVIVPSVCESIEDSWLRWLLGCDSDAPGGGGGGAK
jgi:hypothetical protein